MSLGRLWCEYFENTSRSSSSEESFDEDEPDSWLFNDQSDNRHREFCRMRQLSTAFHKNNQDFTRSKRNSEEKHYLCVAKCSLRGLTEGVDEDSWDEDDSHKACSRNFLFPRSPSSLALLLFIVLNLNSFHEIFFRGVGIRRRITFDTHEN